MSWFDFINWKWHLNFSLLIFPWLKSWFFQSIRFFHTSLVPSPNNKNLSLGFPKQSPLYQDRSHPFSKRMWQLSNSSLCLEKKSLKQVCDVEIYTVLQFHEVVTVKISWNPIPTTFFHCALTKIIKIKCNKEFNKFPWFPMQSFESKLLLKYSEKSNITFQEKFRFLKIQSERVSLLTNW